MMATSSGGGGSNRSVPGGNRTQAGNSDPRPTATRQRPTLVPADATWTGTIWSTPDGRTWDEVGTPLSVARPTPPPAPVANSQGASMLNDGSNGPPSVPAAPPPPRPAPATNSQGSPMLTPAGAGNPPNVPAQRAAPVASAAPASAAAAGVPAAQPAPAAVGGGAPEVPAAPPAVDARQSVRWNGSTYEVEVNPGNWVPTPVEMVQQGYRDGTLRFTDANGRESGRVFNLRQNEDTGGWEMLEIGADGQPVGGPTNWKPVHDESMVQGILARGEGLLVPHYQGEQARIPGQQGAQAQAGAANAKQEGDGSNAPQTAYRLNTDTNTWEQYDEARGWVSAGGTNVDAVINQGRGYQIPYREGGQTAAVPSGVLPTSGQVGTVTTAQTGQQGAAQGKNGFAPVKGGFDLRTGADGNKYDVNDVQEYGDNPGGRMYFIKNKETGRYDNFDYNDPNGPLQKAQKAEAAGSGAASAAAGGPAVPTAPPPVGGIAGGGMGAASQAAMQPSFADQQKERDAQRERDLALLGQNFERPSGIPQRFSKGGMLDAQGNPLGPRPRDDDEEKVQRGIASARAGMEIPRMASGGQLPPPVPDDNAAPTDNGPAVPTPPPSLNAIVGEGKGRDGQGANRAELVLIPTGDPDTFKVYRADGPLGADLPDGTVIWPAASAGLDQMAQRDFAPLPGRPLAQNGDQFSDAATGAPIPSTPAGPPAYEFGGTVQGQNPYANTGYNPYAGLTPPQAGNARQFAQMNQAQMDRYNQSLIAAGDLEGAQGVAARLNRTAPPNPDGLRLPYYN